MGEIKRKLLVVVFVFTAISSGVWFFLTKKSPLFLGETIHTGSTLARVAAAEDTFRGQSDQAALSSFNFEPITSPLFQLPPGSVTSVEILDHTIEAEDIDGNSITSRTIRDDTILGRDIYRHAALDIASLTLAEGISVGGDASVTGDLTVSGDITARGALDLVGNLGIRSLAYTWPSAHDNGVLSNDGAGQLTWQTLGAASITADSLDFSEFKDALALDASTDILVDGTEVFSLTNTGTGNSFLVNDVASDTTPFVIDASGNVGIGTGSPVFPLEVNGNPSAAFGIGDGAPKFAFGWADTATYHRFRSAGGDNSNIILELIDPSTHYFSISGDLKALQGATVGYSAGTTPPANGLLVSGNVGIGDTSPAALLTVGSGDLFQVNSSGAIAAATGITSSGTITFSGLSAGGVVQAAAGTGVLSVSTIGATSITADSLDFTEFQDQLDLDASTDILADGTEVFSLTNTGTGNSFLVNDVASDTTPFVIDATGNVGIGTITPSQKLEVNGDVKIGNAVLSGTGTDNFEINALINSIEIGTSRNTIGGGGSTVAPNIIGTTSLPFYNDFTPTDWAADTSYVAQSANVALIAGGYDNIVNQEAGVIVGGGHNFMKYNSNGHSIIGGGSYNLISAGRSGIVSGRRNTITGASEVFSFIGGGDDNNIIGSYSAILGGRDIDITGDYSSAFGRRAKVTADGSVAFSDSTDSDFTVSTANQFGARYSGGYTLTGGRFQITDDLASDGTLAQFYDLTSDVALDIRSNTGGSGLAAKHIDLVGISSVSDLAFSPSSDTRRALVIKDGGNVGIGTTTPGIYQLQISDPTDDVFVALNTDDGTGNQYIYFLDGGVQEWHLGRIESANRFGIVESGQGERFTILAGGNVGIGTTSPGTDLNVIGNIAWEKSSGGYVATNHWQGNNPSVGYYAESGLLFGTVTTMVGGGWSEKMRITNTGNVGIGTASPSKKLQVNGGVQIGDATVNSIDFRLTRTTSGLNADANYFVATANTPVHNWIEGGYLTGERAGTITAPNSGYPYYEEWSGNGASTIKTLGFINKTSGSFTISDMLPVLTMARTGNVGIGTTSPGQELEVNGDILLGAATPTLYFGNDSDQYITGNAASNYLSISTANDEIARFNSNGGLALGDDYVATTPPADGMIIEGNVGIGTTAPSQRLVVSGSAIIGDSALDNPQSWGRMLQVSNSGSNGAGISVKDSNNEFNLATYSGAFYISDGVDERITITAAGNVGIGTTSPTAKLDISTGNLNLDNTTNANQYGVISKGGTRFIHNFNYGNNGTVTTEGYNVFVGQDVGNLTMGSTATQTYHASYNTAVGYASLYSNTTGYQNSAQGAYSLYSNTTGYNNSAQGHASLYLNTTGNNNSAQGYRSLYSNTTGNQNSALGTSAGRYIADGATGRTTGNNGLYLGYNSKASADGTDNEIAIGYNTIGAGSNSVVLGNTSVTKTLLNGNVGIGDTSPDDLLNVHSASAAAQIAITSLGTDTDPTLGFQLTDGTNTFTIGVDDSDSDKFKIYSGDGLGSGDEFVIDTDGNTTIASLILGSQSFETDAGAVSWVDMPVTSSAVDNTVESYTAMLDGNAMLTVYGLSDGAGSVDNLGVGIMDTTPDGALDFDLTITSTTAATQYGGNFTVSDTGIVTTGTDTTYGTATTVTRTGATGGTIDTYGTYISLTNTFASGSGTANGYGSYISATGSTTGTNTLYGQYVTVSGADTNYSGIFMGGNFGVGDATPSALLTVGSGDLFQVSSAGNVSTVGQINGTDGLVTKVNTGTCDDSVFTLDTDGNLCVDSTNGRLYYRYGGSWHYSAQTAGFQIPNYEVYAYDFADRAFDTARPLAENDFLIPFVENFMEDGAAHGLYAKFSDVKDTLFHAEQQQISTLSLQTSQQITTLTELRVAVDDQLTVIGDSLAQYEETIEQQGDRLDVLDNDIVTLRDVVDIQDELLGRLVHDVESTVSQTALFTSQIATLTEQVAALTDFYITFELGSLGSLVVKDDDGNVDLLNGKLKARILETGLLTIEADDPEEATIGRDKIESGENVVTVKTTAVQTGSHIIVTPRTLTAEPLAVTAVTEGEDFTVEKITPASEDILFDWWIVEGE